jgi:hypothetical protein
MLTLCTLVGGWIYWQEIIKWQNAFIGKPDKSDGLEPV